MSAEALNVGELERYARPLALPDWDEEAQLRLRRGRALVVGAGALGSPVGLYLAAAGVGRLGIVDDERVELSDLAVEVAHFTPDIGVGKSPSAVAKLRFLNPDALIESYPARVEAANAAALVAEQDVVVDCSGSSAARYLLNDACCSLGVPLVVGATRGWRGLTLTVLPGAPACWRCAFPAPPGDASAVGVPDGDADAGLLGPVAGVVGSWQALAALRLLGGMGEPGGRLVEVDAADLAVTRTDVERRPDCPACARGGAGSL